MDDIVRQAMRKWPNVPHCYGWLGLDMRGDWYMRDAQVQAQGSFAQAKGAKLQHDKLIDFIGRNYEVDERGCWFFQNGPQRVYVELQITPWVWRLQPDGEVRAHTGAGVGNVTDDQAWVDESGLLYLHTHLGLGLVHTQDVGLASEWIEQGRWHVQEVRAQDLPATHRYVLSPQAMFAAAQK
jgi:hypothetical protein